MKVNIKNFDLFIQPWTKSRDEYCWQTSNFQNPR